MSAGPRLLRLFTAFAAVALALTACGNGESVTIGSADFDEAELVASMYALVLEDAGYEVNREFLFGSRETYYAALAGGDLDLVPEYIGTLVVFLTAGEGEPTDDPQATADQASQLVADDGLVLLEPSDAQNANGFVVTSETAQEHGLTSISDLERGERPARAGRPAGVPGAPAVPAGPPGRLRLGVR